MIVAKRITPSFSGAFVEPAARENTSGGLDPHLRGASSGILDRLFTLKAGLLPMVDVAFASDVVRRNASTATIRVWVGFP
jgi:hypothetical protein